MKVRYLIVNASSPCNITIDRSAFNTFETALSMLYKIMKYPLEEGQVGVIKGDQGLARKCYKDSLKLKNKLLQDYVITEDPLKVNLVNLNPWKDPLTDSLKPIGELKKIQIGEEEFQTK